MIKWWWWWGLLKTVHLKVVNVSLTMHVCLSVCPCLRPWSTTLRGFCWSSQRTLTSLAGLVHRDESVSLFSSSSHTPTAFCWVSALVLALWCEWDSVNIPCSQQMAYKDKNSDREHFHSAASTTAQKCCLHACPFICLIIFSLLKWMQWLRGLGRVINKILCNTYRLRRVINNSECSSACLYIHRPSCSQLRHGGYCNSPEIRQADILCVRVSFVCLTQPLCLRLWQNPPSLPAKPAVIVVPLMRNSPSLRPAEAPQVLQATWFLSLICVLSVLSTTVFRSLFTAFVGLRGRHGASSWKLAHWKFPANICQLGCIVGNVEARHWDGRRIWLLWFFRKNVTGPIRLCCKIIKNVKITWCFYPGLFIMTVKFDYDVLW